MAEEPKKILTLSNSSISTFRQCPRKFYYEYVLRSPRKPKDYFILGTFVHEVLEVFYKSLMENKNQKRSLLMKECWIGAKTEHPEATDQILQDAKMILQEYLTRVISKHELPKKMEQENKFNVEVNGVSLTGVIDRIDFGENDEIAIIDYKTGKRAKSKKDFEDDLQLPIYTIAAQKMYNAPLDKITCKLDHLRIKTEQELIPTKEIIQKATTAIVESYQSIQNTYGNMENGSQKWSTVGPQTVEEIKKFPSWTPEFESRFVVFITKFSRYWKPVPGWYCNFCDYNKICKNTMW